MNNIIALWLIVGCAILFGTIAKTLENKARLSRGENADERLVTAWSVIGGAGGVISGFLLVYYFL